MLHSSEPARHSGMSADCLTKTRNFQNFNKITYSSSMLYSFSYMFFCQCYQNICTEYPVNIYDVARAIDFFAMINKKTLPEWLWVQ